MVCGNTCFGPPLACESLILVTVYTYIYLLLLCFFFSRVRDNSGIFTGSVLMAVFHWLEKIFNFHEAASTPTNIIPHVLRKRKLLKPKPKHTAVQVLIHSSMNIYECSRKINYMWFFCVFFIFWLARKEKEIFTIHMYVWLSGGQNQAKWLIHQVQSSL